MAVGDTKALRTPLDAKSAYRIRSCGQDQGFLRRAAAAARRNAAAQQQQVPEVQRRIQRGHNQDQQVEGQARRNQQQSQQIEPIGQLQEVQQAQRVSQVYRPEQHQQPGNLDRSYAEVANAAIHRWLQQGPIQEPWTLQGRSSRRVAIPELTIRARASSSTRATRPSSECDQESPKQDEHTLQTRSEHDPEHLPSPS